MFKVCESATDLNGSFVKMFPRPKVDHPQREAFEAFLKQIVEENKGDK